MVFGFGRKKKVIGIGLDGVPLSLAMSLMESGRMPNLKKLADAGSLKEIHSVLPTVSNVAWAAFQTGAMPGEFGVFGFTSLKADMGMHVPNAADIRVPTLWQRLTDAGKRMVVLGVPMTWPAPKVNGVLVSGFLAPRLDERAVSSPDVLGKLRWTQYELDVDASIAQDSLDEFEGELTRVSTRRYGTALELMDKEEWDLFFVHVMETDRINHFMWEFRDKPDAERGQFFLNFYTQVDEFIGKVAARLDKHTELMILSDHGFCDLKHEVQLNRWLRDEGYLDYDDEPEKLFQALRRGSRAVSLVPGRIHILTKFDCEIGTVVDMDYPALRDEIMAKLRDLKHPETGEAVCKRVLTRQEAYSGAYIDRAPDIVIEPTNGFDLKARLGDGPIFEHGALDGMHTYDDAMLLTTSGLAPIAKASNVAEVGAQLADYLLG